jgi:hypothetical protein
MKRHRPLATLAFGAVAVTAALAALPASAVLNTPVTVSLIAPGGATSSGFTDPTPVSATQSLTYAATINPSNGGAVGSLMLPGEQVLLSGESLRISSYSGDDTGGVFTTGWLGLGANNARYVFSGLGIAGRNITGYTVSGFDGFGNSGFEGAVSGTVFTSMVDTNSDGSLDSFSLNLSSLRFKPRTGVGSSEFHADFRIDFISSPVPEASTWAMTLAGLAALSWANLRRRRLPTLGA